MSDPVLVIRNITALSNDELQSILQLADIDKPSFGDSDIIKNFLELVGKDNKAGIREHLKSTDIRDYLYEKIELKRGAHIILHFNESEGSLSEKEYILSKIREIESNTTLSLLYIGGGHGGYQGLTTTKLLSGLHSSSIDEIAQALKDKAISMQSGILHSCYSAWFISLFRPLLVSDTSPLLSYLAELSASSHWDMMVSRVMCNEEATHFYSGDALAKPWEAGELETTTGVLSTQYTNQYMDLTSQDVIAPVFLDTSGEAIAQREFLMSKLKDESGIVNLVETEIDKFNEIVIMDFFNEYFASLTAEANNFMTMR